MISPMFLLSKQLIFLRFIFCHAKMFSIRALEYHYPFLSISDEAPVAIALLPTLVHFLLIPNKALEIFILCSFHALINLSLAEHTMIKITSTAFQHFINKLNSHASAFETTHSKQITSNSFVFHQNSNPIILNRVKPIRIGA